MKLKEYIDKHNTKVNALARRCGISEGAIRYIIGGRDMKLTIAAKIVEGTYGQVTFEDLAAGINEPKSKKNKKG